MELAPDWLVLIRHWTGGKNVGYALPFLAGARALSQSRPAAISDCVDIVTEMFHPTARLELLQLVWCHNLKAPVFGLNKMRIPGVVFKSHHTQEPSVVVQQTLVEEWGSEYERILDSIIEFCQEPIAAGLVSRTWRGTWETYSNDELRRIRNLLHLSEDFGA